MTNNVEDASTVTVLPAPRHMVVGGGSVVMPLAGRILESTSVGDDACVLAGQLTDDIERATGVRWDIGWGDNRGAHWSGFITLGRDDSMALGSYSLTIAEDGVVVVGGGFEGTRNGVQTLRQIIRQCAPALPSLTIEDTPDYAVRGYYLDVTRGRVPTLDWLKRWADELCLYKYNQLQLYVEHTFRFDGLSGTWRGMDALEPCDIIEFDRYCAERGIELVPSVSTFGHLYTALRSLDLRDLGEFPEDADRPFSFIERMAHHTLNIADERALKLSYTLIDSYLELFRTKKFNICADETFDLGKGRSRRYAERVGVAAMYADYVSALCRHLSEQGHEPMMWGDIALEMPEILGRLPKDVVMLNWEYSPNVTDGKVRQVSEAGIRQYVCPAVWGWSNLAPRMRDAWGNISRMARYGLRYGAEGILVTDWGDFGHVNDPRLVVPGMMYGAAMSWNAGAYGDEDDTDRAIDVVQYDGGAWTAALHRVDEDSSFRWYDLVQYVELDDGEGRLNRGVAELLYIGNAEQSVWVRSSTSLEEARTRLMTVLRDRVAAGPRANDDLRDLLRHLPRAVSEESRTMIMQPLLVAIHGQMLLNTAGWIFAIRAGAVEESELGLESGSELSARLGDLALETAQALERWAETYAQTWCEISRESELRRILELIWRCSDELRTKPNDDTQESAMEAANHDE